MIKSSIFYEFLDKLVQIHLRLSPRASLIRACTRIQIRILELKIRRIQIRSRILELAILGAGSGSGS